MLRTTAARLARPGPSQGVLAVSHGGSGAVRTAAHSTRSGTGSPSSLSSTSTSTSVLTLPLFRQAVPTTAALPRLLSQQQLVRISPSRSISTSIAPRDKHKSEEQRRREEQEEDEESERQDREEEERAKKGSIRERLRYLMRRYGWWALGVYNAIALVDFSLTFCAVHFLGAEHIRQLETKVRDAVGLSKREESDEEKAEREEEERQQAQQASNKSGGGSGASSSLWTEAVLAYTIHKTLLLPIRVGITAAVTPSFVKWLAKMGWAKSAAAVRRAAKEAAAKKAAKKAAASN